jgi:hypothetical protein
MARVICQNTFLEMIAIEDEELMQHGIRKRSMTADAYFREEPFNVVVDSQLQRLNRLLDSNDRPLIDSVSVEEHVPRLVQLGKPFVAPQEDSDTSSSPRASSATSREKFGRTVTASTRVSSPSSSISNASSPHGRETWAGMEDEEGNEYESPRLCDSQQATRSADATTDPGHSDGSKLMTLGQVEAPPSQLHAEFWAHLKPLNSGRRRKSGGTRQREKKGQLKKQAQILLALA